MMKEFNGWRLSGWVTQYSHLFMFLLPWQDYICHFMDCFIKPFFIFLFSVFTFFQLFPQFLFSLFQFGIFSFHNFHIIQQFLKTSCFEATEVNWNNLFTWGHRYLLLLLCLGWSDKTYLSGCFIFISVHFYFWKIQKKFECVTRLKQGSELIWCCVCLQLSQTMRLFHGITASEGRCEISWTYSSYSRVASGATVHWWDLLPDII